MRRVPGLQARLLDVAENGGFTELINLLTACHLTYEVGEDAPAEQAESDGASEESDESSEDDIAVTESAVGS
jgi:hypothetical protein